MASRVEIGQRSSEKKILSFPSALAQIPYRAIAPFFCALHVHVQGFEPNLCTDETSLTACYYFCLEKNLESRQWFLNVPQPTQKTIVASLYNFWSLVFRALIRISKLRECGDFFLWESNFFIAVRVSHFS